MRSDRYDRTWDTVDDMLRDADQAHQAGKQHEFKSSSFIGREFAGWDEIKAQANVEWAEGLQIIRDMKEQIERRCVELPPPADRRRKRRWSDDGDELDHDRLRSGQEFWARCERQTVAGPQTVTLFVGVTASAFRDAKDVLWRGAAAIVLADILERHGYQVEIFGVQNVTCAYRNGHDLTQGVCLKRADQPLDTSTLVNALSGWFYRTIWFQAYYVEASTPTGGLGHVVPLSIVNKFVMERAGNGKAVVIDALWSEDEAIVFILGTINSINEGR